MLHSVSLGGGAGRQLPTMDETYRSVFEAGSEGLLIHEDGIIVAVNPQFEQLLGYKESELVGESFMKLVAKRSRAIVTARMGTHASVPFEIEGLKGDGTIIQVEVVGKDHQHEGRTVRLVTVRDLTERKEAEHALRESADWLTLAEAAGGVGTFDWDIVKNTAKCSDQFFRLFGIDPSVGVTLEEFLGHIHENDSERVLEEVKHALERDAPYATEYRVRWPDGSIHWISDRAQVIRDDEGRPVRFHGAITDITERKRLEKELRRAREELEGRVERQMMNGNPYGLTFRELTVLSHVTDGVTDKEIGARLDISTFTVHKHVAKIRKKMGASSRTEVGTRVLREGLVK